MAQHKHIINIISKQVIPPLSSKLHKGQAGASRWFLKVSAKINVDISQDGSGSSAARESRSLERFGFSKGLLRRSCRSYTGAPFFSAMGAMRFVSSRQSPRPSHLLTPYSEQGADLAHVICEPNAAPTIKSYSPGKSISPVSALILPIDPVNSQTSSFTGSWIPQNPLKRSKSISEAFSNASYVCSIAFPSTPGY